MVSDPGMKRDGRPQLSPQEASSTELASRWKRGVDREESFKRLFEHYHPSVLRFFLRQGYSRDESSDLTQDTFLRASKGISQFREESDFGIWLYQIAHNVLLNERRRLRADKRSGRELSLDSPEHPPSAFVPLSRDSGPLEGLLREESSKRLRAALEGLPGQMRRCVLLRTYQGLKYHEISTLMGISIETVKAHLHQARKRLSQEFGDEVAEP